MLALLMANGMPLSRSENDVEADQSLTPLAGRGMQTSRVPSSATWYFTGAPAAGLPCWELYGCANRDSPAVAATCQNFAASRSRQTLDQHNINWLTIAMLIEFIFECAQAGFYGKPSARLKLNRRFRVNLMDQLVREFSSITR
jgi:hypothetical protein